MLDAVTLYVAPHARALGVSRPGVPSKSCIDRKCATHTSDWRFDPGSPENHHRVERVYVPTSLEELTRRRYRSEAHFVAYELFDVKTGLAIGAQPRLKKDCLGWLREQGYDVRLVAFLVDVDTPGHVPWTPELRAEFDELWARREGTLLDRCGAYLSPKGYRLCQPLAKPLPVEEGERALKLFLHRIVEENKVWASARDVSDWTRNMRTPHHNRQGVLIESPWQDWAKVGVLEPEVPAEAPQRVRAKRTNAAHAPRPVDRFDEVCPAGWEPVADEVGVAIRDTVTADWRRCYLALAGALLERGCPPEGVPAVVRRAAEAAGAGDKLGDRVTIATDTVLRWSANVDVSGASVLRLKFPAVAEAIDESISSGAESSILRQLRGKERTITDVTEATNTLRREIRDAYGTVLIRGSAGPRQDGVGDRAREEPQAHRGARDEWAARRALRADDATCDGDPRARRPGRGADAAGLRPALAPHAARRVHLHPPRVGRAARRRRAVVEAPLLRARPLAALRERPAVPGEERLRRRHEGQPCAWPA